MTATATAVRERPILFSGPMVRALLAGTKTQTRRVCAISDVRGVPVVKLRNGYGATVRDGMGLTWVPFAGAEEQPMPRERVHDLCPYGAPGDRLWVRETWAARGKHTDGYTIAEIAGNRSHFEIWYAAQCYEHGRARFNLDFLGKWRPSIHMPRSLSRLTLEITDVRVERVQDISEDDAIAEGCHDSDGAPTQELSGTARGAYALLWNELNAARGFGWDVNPWVWVLTFRRVAC